MNTHIVLFVLLVAYESYCLKQKKNVNISNNTIDSATTEVTTSVPSTTAASLTTTTTEESTPPPHVPCSCAVYLSGQFVKGKQPTAEPILNHIHDNIKFPCNGLGNKLCTNKCLEMIVKHLPSSAKIICNAIEHDIYRKKAYLFIKNCNSKWIYTNLSAGREYCCKDNRPIKCSLMSPPK